MSEAAIEVAKLHLHESKLSVNYQQITTEQSAEQYPQTFDVITCMEMLEHVPDPQSIIVACDQMLKPGGTLFLSTLNRNAKSFIKAIVGAEYLLKLLPKGTHQYQRFIKPSELMTTTRSLGLDCIGSTGIDYQPFSKRYCLVDSLDVNYILAFQKHGWVYRPMGATRLGPLLQFA